MKPDEKYMPSSYRKSDDDLNFIPFTSPSPLIGWTPQNLFDGSSVNNIPNSMIMTPQMNSQLNLPKLGVNPNMNQQTQQPNLYPNQNNMGYNTPINTWQLPSQAIDTNPSSMGYGEPLSANFNANNTYNPNIPSNQGINTNPSSMGLVNHYLLITTIINLKTIPILLVTKELILTQVAWAIIIHHIIALTTVL